MSETLEKCCRFMENGDRLSLPGDNFEVLGMPALFLSQEKNIWYGFQRGRSAAGYLSSIDEA